MNVIYMAPEILRESKTRRVATASNGALKGAIMGL